MPTPQDELQYDPYRDRRPNPPVLPGIPDPRVQRKRMLIALGVLLVALVAVVLKDWDFWFPASEETPEAAIARRTANPSAAKSAPAAQPKAEKKTAKPAETLPGAPFQATAERTALPPLQVEVVAGNRRTKVPNRTNAINLDMNSGTAASAPQAATVTREPIVNAGDHVQLSPEAAQSVSVSVPPDYPLLARQMKVQGAVILQALISREGSIQQLQIVSGPAILAAAAREAVKQWRFKPYFQSGQPVETQARITVNFTISTN